MVCFQKFCLCRSIKFQTYKIKRHILVLFAWHLHARFYKQWISRFSSAWRFLWRPSLRRVAPGRGSLLIRGGRPNLTPLALASSRPSLVRSKMRSLSAWATAERMVTTIRPIVPSVVIPSSRKRTATPF